ncbi:hypothetical protein ZIOFF_003730 [Zingiber officinale]|uniref:Uncharacterized protein n=2 Tax=Magnoliopsida TaxID=3398 RepID=A0A8J5M004_ZINOF|nr:hypothetical protein ZIOFF_003730 [Zingiber officinale]
MAQIPNLDTAPLNLTSLREQSQKELLNILKNVRFHFPIIRGNKCLVIDPKLSGSLSLLIQTSLLKENGVELRHLSSEPVQTECSKILYLVRSHTNLMKLISSNIHNDLSKGVQREYFLYFVPRRTIVCEKIFEDEKIHHLLTIGEYPLYMLPLDEDVISFELDLSYKECCVDGDTSSLWHIAKAIHKLELILDSPSYGIKLVQNFQFSFGFIPNVRAKGKASTKVAEILNSLQVEEPVSSTDLGIPEINTLILLDREVDLVTPMCFQLTYEGLLDEVSIGDLIPQGILQINNGSVEVDTTVMGSQQDGKKVKVPLNSSDKLFKEIRDMNFEVVVQVLRQKATSIQQDYAEVKSQVSTITKLFTIEMLIFEDEKIHHLLTIGEYPLYMLPLDEDVISFELDLSYKECCVDGDTSSLWHIAKAIHKLEVCYFTVVPEVCVFVSLLVMYLYQLILDSPSYGIKLVQNFQFSFGFIPNVRAKGKASTKVAEILNSLQVEEPVSSTDLGIPEINTLILLDREVDLVTPMCFQLTYEGLLDEVSIGDLIPQGVEVEVDTTVMGSQQDGKKVKVPLNSSDKLFKEIRDMNFEVVVQVLRQKATSIQQDYAEVKSQVSTITKLFTIEMLSQSVSELKDFVKKLNSLPEIARHVNLAQHLQSFTSKPSFHARLDMEQTLLELQNYDICFEYIEEMIHKQESLANVLRLLVLFSITNSGLPKKNFDYLR